MSRRLQENVVALFVLLIFVATIYASLGYGPRARLVPIPIAAIGIVLIVGQLVLQNFRSEKDLEIDLLELISRKSTGDHDPVVPDPHAGEAEKTAAAEAQRGAGKREFGALGLVVLIVGMFLVIGPLPTMFFFTAGYFVLSRHANIAMSLLYGLLATGVVYALFYLWLGVDMRQGLIDLSFGLW